MNTARVLGAVAAGHRATSDAAAFALREGGNAFDAVIAAHWTACVAEPVLTSLGGGGFLIAQPHAGAVRVYDFFTHTPRRKRPVEEVDFHPIQADFGTTRQEFHIGYGSIATPGTVRGLFAIHRDLARLPMAVLAAPAVQAAREGLSVNRLQAYILDVVRPIYLASPAAAERFGSCRDPGRLVGENEVLRQPELADTLLALVQEGDRLFYEGDIAAAIDRACNTQGGYLRRQDLEQYQLKLRKPLQVTYRGARLLTNPPPSSGGLLIAFALKLLERLDAGGTAIDSPAGLSRLAEVMRLTNEARLKASGSGLLDERLLDADLIELYLTQVRDRSPARRGTTHISVVDRAGNIAALTTSNGEGCGHLLDDTGIMLNNMLGEEDLNPHGFHQWQENRRLTSMMSPSILQLDDTRCVALGSGGSNRIRSALLQVLLRLVDDTLPLEEAIRRPRIHYENEQLNIEAGFPESVYDRLQQQFPTSCWPGANLFFGGVHAVGLERDGFVCSGDQRRGGVAEVVR